MKQPLPTLFYKIDALVPFKNNARTHSPKQIQQIANSIQQFGFTNPVLIDATGRILAGHGRVKAAQKLGLTEVPVIRLEHLNEAEIRAYILADNKIAANAGWDQEILAIELEYLSTVADLDIDITGFEMGEIDVILNDVKTHDTADEIPNVDMGASHVQ